MNVFKYLIPECNGRTDRRTDRQTDKFSISISHVSVLTSNKNYKNPCIFVKVMVKKSVALFYVDTM